MKKAFSLIELSIVIIIISVLLTIGFKSSEIVKNYEIKRVLAVTQEYENSLKAFYQFYNVTAGDTNNGYKLFADDNCLDEVISSTAKGCNGDADGVIDLTEATQTTDSYESILAFYHLFKAKLIAFDNNNDLNLANVTANNNLSDCTGETVFNSAVNIPALGIRNSALFIYKLAANDISLMISSGDHCSLSSLKGVFTVEELMALETKYDDGLPESGLIQTNAATTICFSGTAYDLSKGTTKLCNLIYKFDFTNQIVNKF